ncbi:MAG: sigma-70 family RNA polymerase sigma factor [Holophagales bacterium]|nr:sigma-70 family RNA polymerase sigma factor [Holophagales bacterium]
MASEKDVTGWLLAWREGDEGAFGRLVEAVYGDLRRLAAAVYAGERNEGVLQPTALVHEAFLRLVGQRRVRWQNRAHFLAVAAKQMRRILVDQARRRSAAKRGGRHTRVLLGEDFGWARDPSYEVDALEQALLSLERFAPRQGKVVELRFFGGLTIDETAEVLEISPATVKVDWKLARAWLSRELEAGVGASGGGD